METHGKEKGKYSQEKLSTFSAHQKKQKAYSQEKRKKRRYCLVIIRPINELD